MDFNNSSRRFRPLGSRVMALWLPRLTNWVTWRMNFLQWDYTEKWVTPPKRVTSRTWGPPPPCKQALNLSLRRRLVSPIYCKLQQMTTVTFNHVDHVFSVTSNVWSDEACFTRRIKSITCMTVYGQVHNFNCPQQKKPGEKWLLEITVNCALTKRSRRLGTGHYLSPGGGRRILG